MITVGSYIEYFRQVAVNHPKIQHDVVSEGKNGPAGKRGFTLFTAEEVLKQLRFSVNPENATLHLNVYEGVINLRNSNYQKDSGFRGAFMITKKVIGKEALAISDVFIETEEIVNDIIEGMINTSIYGDKCVIQWLVEQFNINPIGPIWDGRYGWLVEFDFYKK